MTNKAIVIAGPTASGKSALALAVAQEFGGIIINADSMQVYDVLGIVTARPSPEDEARVPHRLYGVLPPSEMCSAGRWQDMAEAEMRAAWAAGRLPVIVGGTGLYIRALTEGLSPIPAVPDDVRQAARALFERLGNDAFHAALAGRDPVMAARLHPGNSQRLVRAWEVLEATGKSLAEWQEAPPQGAAQADFATFVLAPPREALYASCDGRFLKMIELGALAEVAALDALALDPALPAMKALGVPELRALLHGEMSLDDAVAAAQQATRRYAKRQLTWFRHQIRNPFVVETKYSESLNAKIFPNIRGFLLTGTG